MRREQVGTDEGTEQVASDEESPADATLIDPAMHAAVDVDRLLSEAAGLQRIVDLAGQVAEGERPTPEFRPDAPTTGTYTSTGARPSAPVRGQQARRTDPAT